MKMYTLPKTNMDPEKGPTVERKSNLQTIIFWVATFKFQDFVLKNVKRMPG